MPFRRLLEVLVIVLQDYPIPTPIQTGGREFRYAVPALLAPLPGLGQGIYPTR